MFIPNSLTAYSPLMKVSKIKDQSVLPTRLNMKVKTGRVDMLFVSNETMEEDVFLCEDKKRKCLPGRNNVC